MPVGRQGNKRAPFIVGDCKGMVDPKKMAHTDYAMANAEPAPKKRFSSVPGNPLRPVNQCLTWIQRQPFNADDKPHSKRARQPCAWKTAPELHTPRKVSASQPVLCWRILQCHITTCSGVMTRHRPFNQPGERRLKRAQSLATRPRQHIWLRT
jgi:hypothetical protein